MFNDTNLRQKFETFSEINEQFSVVFKIVESRKDLGQDEKRECLLEYISREIFIIPQYFAAIVKVFSTEIPLLLEKAIEFNKTFEFNHSRHICNSILLSKVVQIRSDTISYALQYFEKYRSLFEEESQKFQKRSRTSSENIKDLDIVKSCYFLLRSDPKFFRHKWNWSTFIRKNAWQKDYKLTWHAFHIIGFILGLNEPILHNLLLKRLPEEYNVKYTVDFNMGFKASQLLKNIYEAPEVNKNPIIPKNTKCSSHVVDISGIYISAAGERNNGILVDVPSTFNNLRKIALGLLSSKALCLLGAVGSGKTALIEHLALITGRKLGDNFIKIQLGDQTDSKMLLGTYSCTDIPGEFVWQPGVLTQAVINGNWLLMEDIDLVNADIASVLASLLENNALSVPGYRDLVPVKPGFQLIVTQRLMPTMTGHHKKSLALLDKQLLQVFVDPLTNDELKQILHVQYPLFDTVADRLISVFNLFSSDNYSASSMRKSGRLISTRDFFKWCSRSAVNYDVKSQASALQILQDAIDVFCCSFLDTSISLSLAKEISTNLGIVEQKAEYFFTTYKPTMQLTSSSLTAGRVSLNRSHSLFHRQTKFCFTRPAAVLLERIMCCVKLGEPVLLVGETGTGKTSSVQYLAHCLGKKLVVINMNQQSDSADLLGGFKPIDLKLLVAPIKTEFETLFHEFYAVGPNKPYLSKVAFAFNTDKFPDLVRLLTISTQAALNRLRNKTQGNGVSQNPKDQQFFVRWEQLHEKLKKIEIQVKQPNALAFSFIEGSLVKAVQDGSWVLLDEINLANAETLECLSGLLESNQGSLCLMERGDKHPVKRHRDFTLFACMNPATNVGKKDLPFGLRNRFTEFYVDELTEKSDLILLVNNYLESLSLKQSEVCKIVDFYLNIRKEMNQSLCDGQGHKPHFSLRSLCRALMTASKNPCGNFKRSLYESFCLSFLTQLDTASYKAVESMIGRYLIGSAKELNAVMKQPIPEPKDKGSQYLQFEGYWIKKGTLDANVPDEYILTESVRKNLKDLSRIVSIGKLPVLLQGDTSVGKTSLIMYLAKSSGNRCVRINNHEHTDLQEYIGSYVASATGKLVFREGVLVEAMRKGHWIILDELNLAPTDVLEALNRVLDDNRELFIPETQETVRAHPNFMLFATQNPPGTYGGRKTLSRAFRNRFVELHFNEIPPSELEFILHKRCAMPPSYAKRMVSVMKDLQIRRRGSAAFAGKQGFITLRDLFRWGERYRLAPNTGELYDWNQHLIDEGFLVLAGKVRKEEESNEIIQVLQKHWQRNVERGNLFSLHKNTSTVTRKVLQKIYDNRAKYPNIVMTFNMDKMAVLVSKALEFNEPVLLVGETGGGKTTICQLIADVNDQELISLSCHMNTESSDFIGGLRPVREHSDDSRLFEWIDGPLITAMRKGSVFLADEISLADDSVLERLNSLLEPERTLLLAEKGVDINNINNSESITAHPKFCFIGTMNPAGDFGKKELSPALRNRFTEIWWDNSSLVDLRHIIRHSLKVKETVMDIASSMCDFFNWFGCSDIGKRYTISIRDVITWVNFINLASKDLSAIEAYVHGVYLVFLDSFGSGVTSAESFNTLEGFKSNCIRHLFPWPQALFMNDEVNVSKFGWDKMSSIIKEDILKRDFSFTVTDKQFGVHPFYIPMGEEEISDTTFSFDAPTTRFNTFKILRGMQLNKAILLEGSPGVGKTSLVTALAKSTGHKIFRINLSDQTDVSDLFGADLPVEGGTGGQFAWRDGPLLQALKDRCWILLDELNLASQSVLEGLNACLDHRGEIFIPELGKTFYVEPGTRFFACQNPMKQGGSRRGLPKSFLNRFIQVYISPFNSEDMEVILLKQFPSLPKELIEGMIRFNYKLANELDNHHFGLKGSPWECNLRDLTRWCEATLYHYKSNGSRAYSPESTVQLIYMDRMRMREDKKRVADLFTQTVGREIIGSQPVAYINKEKVFFGDSSVDRSLIGFNENVLEDKGYLILRCQLGTLRSLSYCVNQNWMAILVGSSGVGKSSVVKTLASLAGKTLRTLPVTSAMDTTDILGGFEQTNYSRHLEELVQQAERLTLIGVRDLLLEENVANAIKLMECWEAYLFVSDVKTHTLDEEVQLFLNKLKMIENLFIQLYSKCNSSQECLRMQQLLDKCIGIYNSVNEEKSLSAGGRFEWVNSVLVKCLQEGSWLLVDNVNLCSAAVLDRLNGLLEPNGTLTISERGMDKEGKMFEVRPHKDFRIFLTMDPKNGEISRAMRNRGIEIYMINDLEDTTKSNQFDLKSLINNEGLSNPQDIDTLIRIHQFISPLIQSDKPNHTDILRCSSLIAKQIDNGIPLDEAFYTTCVEVYYKTRSSSEFSCHNALKAIKDGVYRCLYEETTVEVDLFSKNATVNTRDLPRWSEYVKTKFEVSLFETAMENFSRDFEIARKYLNDAVETKAGSDEYIGSLAKKDRLLEAKDLSVWSDLEYIKLHTELLDCINFYKVANLLINSYTMSSTDNLDYKRLHLKNTVPKKQFHIFVENFNKLARTFESTNHLPLDGRWTHHYTDNNSFDSINYAFQVELHALRDDFEDTYTDSRSLFKAVCMGFDTASTKTNRRFSESYLLKNSLFSKYCDLRYRYFAFVNQLRVKNPPKGAECFVKTIDLLSWRQALHSFLTNVYIEWSWDDRDIARKLDSMIVYYKWFYKYSVKGISQLLSTDVPQDFQKILGDINKEIDYFSRDYKIFHAYRKLNDVPESLKYAWQLSALQILNSYDFSDACHDLSSLICYLVHRVDQRNILQKLKLAVYSHSDKNDDLDMIRNFNEVNDNKNLSIDEFQVQTIPLGDSVVQMMLLRLMAYNETSANREDLSNTLIPVELSAALLNHENNDNNKLTHEIRKGFYSFGVRNASVMPGVFLNEDTPNSTSLVAGVYPIYSYLINRLLDREPTTLQNYRSIEKQRRHVGLLLWKNIYAMSDKSNDFLSMQIRLVQDHLNHFLRRLEEAESKTGYQKTSGMEPVCSIVNGAILKLVELTVKISSNLEDTENSSSDDILCRVADLHILLGYLEGCFNSTLPKVDPLAKKAMKKNHITSVINMFNQMAESYQLTTNLLSNYDDSYHPYYEAIRNHVKLLEDKVKKYADDTTSGVKAYTYSYVTQQITHVFDGVLNKKLIVDALDNRLLENLKTLSDTSENDVERVSRHIERLQTSLPSFARIIHEWKAYRCSYPDILEPLLANVAQLRYGLHLKLYWMKRELLKHNHRVRFNLNLEEELVRLVSFPVLNGVAVNMGEYIDNYTHGKINTFIQKVLEKDDYVKKKEYLRLLKCGIQDYFNYNVIKAKNCGTLDKTTMGKFDNLVSCFVNLWNQQREREEQEQQKSESLYQIKKKCDDKSEQEQIDDELKEMFTNYHVSDFADLQDGDLGDSPPSPPQIAPDSFKAITEDDVQYVIDLHSALLNNFSQSEWISTKFDKNIAPDFTTPLLERFKIARLITDAYASSFKYTTDMSLLGSLSVLLEDARRSLNAEAGGTGNATKDFYKDADVEQVKGCYHVLDELKAKVKELLMQWPDQPTLNTILTVIDRIVSFDITSPLSRFLTGFDILLQKCHEWEHVAHSGVSLTHFSPNLTQQIITWRKIELGRWKDLLNSTFQDMKKSLRKWWIYMYNLMTQYVVDEKVSEADLVDILEKFITTSPLVEFDSRLNLIFTFHLHAIFLARTSNTESFINILWNVYHYFGQFSSTIAQKIKDLRIPIEKKLKEYVKIVRWKDVNYWSIKDTVDKTHKALHKSVREFKEAMSQPVTTFLYSPSVENSIESVGVWDRPQRQNPKAYHYTLDPDSYIIKSPNKDVPFLARARKLCKETISGTEYPLLVKTLDGFVTDVIETSSHLRNLEVDRTLPKEKQVSQAKNVLQQKHRALTDLFQALSKMGLSYKKGIVDVKLKRTCENFTTRPINLAASFDHLMHNRLDEKILTVWDSCETYYYKCLTRLDILERSLVNPAKDLGMANMERCRGFGTELLTNCQTQKENLIRSTRSYYYLRNYSRQIHEACHNSDYITIGDFTEIRDAVDSTLIVGTQIKTIFDSCLPEPSMESHLIDVPTIEPIYNKIRYKQDDAWRSGMQHIDEIHWILKRLATQLRKTENRSPCIEHQPVQVRVLPQNNRAQMFEDIKTMQEHLRGLRTIMDPISVTDSIDWLLETFDKIMKKYNENTEYQHAANTNAVLQEASDSILISIQNIYKKYRDVNLSKNSDEDADETIQENHLKLLIMDNLASDVSLLDLNNILEHVEALTEILLGGRARPVEESKSAASQYLPLLDQVLQLAQYFITQQVCAYRTTCKLTSVILNVFNDLAAKGFCIPPELSEEMDKEGVSKPSDGMGLGEGQGERDVSDKIESEDQLDDAQPAGQEKENAEDPDCKEEDKGIEMSEDFDSKLQDKKPNSDSSDEESDNSDADEQMGETEKGADQVDQEIWGDKDDNQDEDESEENQDDGTGGEKDGEDELGAKDENSKEKPKDQPDKERGESTEKNKEDINEMKEPEYDEEQVDPYHGNQPELPEPEPMDLPDDMQLDDGEENDGENAEENPFDIDENKDTVEDIPEESGEDDKAEKQNDEADEFSSDEEGTGNDKEDLERDEVDEDEIMEHDRNEGKETEDEPPEENPEANEENQESGLDENVTNQENVQTMETDDAQATDKTQASSSENMKSNQPIDELNQEDQPDKDGVGQSQMEENDTGHSAQSDAPEQVKSSNVDDELAQKKKKEKPGVSDSKRSLGDVDQPVQKKLKTIDRQTESTDRDEQENDRAEMYEHIKEASEKTKTQTLDTATREQVEEQKKTVEPGDETEDNDENIEGSEHVPEEEDDVMDVDVAEPRKDLPVKTESNKEKVKNKSQHPEGDIVDDAKETEIEGEIVPTSTVARGDESSYHTQFELLRTYDDKMEEEEINSRRKEVEEQLSSWKTSPVSSEAEVAWQRISSITSTLAQDLSEKLRLILEPTQASRLKGDYRTGRRINMRRIIPYIASQFRKDKIWMRRTKASKREYQIVLAIDDSSSMSDNHSKEMAFECVSLISKALTLLESGQLAVVGFGETTEVHHKLTEPFTENSGAHLLQKFQFGQQKTCVGELMNFVAEMFKQHGAPTSVATAKLLLIVSDGRGVFSEGKTYVSRAVRRAQLQNINTVCIIIDSPENKNSILDIRSTVFKDGKFHGMQNYMDEFPFAFYIILRDVNTLPRVLSDALRQWFEIVTSEFSV